MRSSSTTPWHSLPTQLPYRLLAMKPYSREALPLEGGIFQVLSWKLP
jgi:hypothetical protein